MRICTVTPLGALARGAIAGAAGSLAQNVFFRATSRVTPESPPDAFYPPEREQREETKTQTVARRAVDHLIQRGPLEKPSKAKLGQAIHFGFGAGWGALYGLTRETFPATSTLAGVTAFSLTVWDVSENVLLPSFKLAGWATDYPLPVHGYAIAAHLVYGAAVWATYEALRPTSTALAGSILWALWKGGKLRRAMPKAIRPSRRSILRAARASYSARTAAQGALSVLGAR